jgi:outer membrane protein OmpA-like peptidoglycan-associated protein
VSTHHKLSGVLLGVFMGQLLPFVYSANAQSTVTNSYLIFEIGKSNVSIRGDVSSVAHGSILREKTLALFPEKTKTFDLVEKPALPAGWALISEITLRAIAPTYVSITEITSTSISISGITGNQSEWQKSITQIEKNLLPGMRLSQNISAVVLPIAQSLLCERILVNATQHTKIKFSRLSVTLRSSTFSALDKLIQLMTDCSLASIRIIGHADSTGEPASISLTRAESVSAYLVDHGIRANRISVHEADYSEPLDPTNSYRAHKINRRIEIQIEFPND